MNFPKRVRLQEFFARLGAAPPAGSLPEALQQIVNILTEVEDEMTSIPESPSQWRVDGRMYPPQADSRRDVPGRPGITRFRSVGHNVFIGQNGSIEIRAVESDIAIFSKHGADGRGVWDP